MKRFILVAIGVLLFASPVGAAWSNNWVSNATQAIAGQGTTLTSVTNKAAAVIYAPSSITDNSNAAQLRLQGSSGHTVCLTTDVGAVGNGSGTLTVEVFWFGAMHETTLNNFILLTTLTTGSPCIYDVPQGELVLRSAAAADSNGLVVVRANK